MAGLTLVTVNPAYQKRELKYVLEQSRSEALYYVEEFRGSPMQAIADEACADLPAIRHRIILTDHAALFDGEDRGVLPEVAPDDVTQIQYTSGTTGFPKGALLHHHGLIQNARDTMARLGLGAGDTFMHNMPLFHTTGCAICVLGIIDAGATMLLAPMFDPAMIVQGHRARAARLPARRPDDAGGAGRRSRPQRPRRVLIPSGSCRAGRWSRRS